MPKISRFSDLRAVFLPNDAAFQSPMTFSDFVVLTQDWGGGGLANANPADMMKIYASGNLPAGTSGFFMVTIPTNECWRILGVCYQAQVGTPYCQLGVRDPSGSYFVGLHPRIQLANPYDTAVPVPAATAPPGFQLYCLVDTAVLNDNFRVNVLVIPAGAGQGFNF